MSLLVKQDEKPLPQFSVLMSVYFKEKPQYLRSSLESVFHQTLPATEVILVCDGPLTPELYNIIDTYKSNYPSLKTIQLEKNEGLGNAMNIGLKHCQYELIIRMDTDDIAYPQRFYKQVKTMHERPDIDVMSSYIDEFIDNPQKIESVKRLPTDDIKLAKYSKYRCPVNHPSSIFRKKSITESGGYRHMLYFEDYFLWARVLMNGGKLYCMPESLLAFRMNKDTYERRRGLRYIKCELYLQKELHQIGFTNTYEYIRNLFLRVPPRLLPSNFLSLIYKRLLRR